MTRRCGYNDADDSKNCPFYNNLNLGTVVVERCDLCGQIVTFKAPTGIKYKFKLHFHSSDYGSHLTLCLDCSKLSNLVWDQCLVYSMDHFPIHYNTKDPHPFNAGWRQSITQKDILSYYNIDTITEPTKYYSQKLRTILRHAMLDSDIRIHSDKHIKKVLT